MDGCLWNASSVSVCFLTGMQLAVLHSSECSDCMTRIYQKLLSFLTPDINLLLSQVSILKQEILVATINVWKLVFQL